MSQHTILVVEDNPITLKMMRVALESEGFRVLGALDGRTALELMERHKPDLVLQDLILPDLDGFELLCQLRQVPGGDQVPILAVSGFISRLEEGRLPGVGFNDILVKPVEPSLLIRSVRAYFPNPAAPLDALAAGRHVLLADDDAIQRKLIVLQLRGLGFRVVAAEDGEEALERARALPPDVILSDVFMPRRDGFDLCLAVRQDPRLSHVPVVLYSSFYVEDEDRALAREVGASAWVDRTADLQPIVKALLASLGEGAPARQPWTPGTYEVRARHIQRLIHQLERQATQNASLAQRCALQSAELSVLSGISDALAQAPRVEDILPEVLYRCLDAGGLSRGALYLTDPDGLVLRAKIGYEDLPVGEAEGFFGHSELLQTIVLGGAVVAIPSAAVPEETARDFLQRSRGTYSLIAPLVSRGQRLGAVLMGSRNQKLEEEEWMFFARTVAVQLGQAVALGRAFFQLAASEERYRGLFQSSRDPMLITGKDGCVVDANPATCTLAGYSLEELQPLRIQNLLFPRAVARSGNAVREGDADFRCKDGGRRLVEASASQIAPGQHLHVLRDVTEQRRVEETLRQNEKLATMGELLAGVAHELNNPLSVVVGQAAMLQQALQDAAGSRRVQKILDAGERCARIVGNFLALARQRLPERKQVALNQVVEGCLELLAYQLRVDSVQVALDLASDLPILWADPHQLQQVLVNLMTNAHHALREAQVPRRISLSTQYDPVGEEVSFAVTDTGPGIPPDILGRIFEPFFTTKPPGEGTGLGLSLCKGIIEAHGGTMRVETQPGRGTTFLVELPVLRAPERPADLPPSPEPLHGKAILVVDDEPVVCELLADLLGLDGHQVETASSGHEALDKLQGRTYDLILSDIRMPDLDGPSLYVEVGRLHPDLCRRFVFVTGDLLSTKTRDFLERSGAPSLTKPFALEDVRRVVQVAVAAPAMGSSATSG